jgi:two-component SAPR family response regulator
MLCAWIVRPELTVICSMFTVKSIASLTRSTSTARLSFPSWPLIVNEALGRLGRRSDIVAHYQRYVRLLSEELGLDPPQEVRELYNRLIV